MAILDQLGKGARVAIVRLRSLGDCVLTTPAIALLKQHRPDLRIAVVIEPAFEAVFEGNSAVTDILSPALPALRRFAPRLTVNLHGGTRSMILTALSGARWRAGFAHHRYSYIYNAPIPRSQEILQTERKVHTAEHLASAMFFLGVPPADIPRAQLFAQALSASQPYAVIHAIASASDKTWPAERFLELAGHIRDHRALEPIFIGSPSDDLSAFHPFRTVTPALAETKRLLAGASLFAGNDSGPAHMAAAFGIPLVVLFAVSDPIVWAPWKTQAQSIIAAEGMYSLSTRQVMDAIGRLSIRGAGVRASS